MKKNKEKRSWPVGIEPGTHRTFYLCTIWCSTFWHNIYPLKIF